LGLLSLSKAAGFSWTRNEVTHPAAYASVPGARYGVGVDNFDGSLF
jgi:hypothetical protein